MSANRTRAVALVLLLGATNALPSCIASNLLDTNLRMPEAKAEEREWVPALPADLEGQFESTKITGEAAGSVLKIYYYFAGDGRFTGAALVVGESGPTFQVLEGRWSLVEGKLSLGPDSEPATLQKSGDLLRLMTTEGSVVLRRVMQ
jgi:hypothetical protein